MTNKDKTDKANAGRELMKRADAIQTIEDALRAFDLKPAYAVWQLQMEVIGEANALEGVLLGMARREGFESDDDFVGDYDEEEYYSTTTAEKLVREVASLRYNLDNLADGQLKDIGEKLQRAKRASTRLGELHRELENLLNRRIRKERDLPDCAELWTLDPAEGESVEARTYAVIKGLPVQPGPPGPCAVLSRWDWEDIRVAITDEDGVPTGSEPITLEPREHEWVEGAVRLAIARLALLPNDEGTNR